MKKVDFLIILSVFVGVFLVISQAQAYIFSRELKIGDEGIDVLELQKVLNSSPDTQISLSGIGSPGQESTYFGILTHKAVIKYQNKYKNDILLPSGLQIGTGFVGEATRRKLNSASSPLSPTSQVPETVKPPISQPTKVINSNPISEIQLFSLSEIKTAPGRKIVATGNGFNPKNNTIYIGNDIKIENLSSTNSGSMIEFTVPNSISEGTYEITVATQDKNTKKASFKPSIVVGNRYIAKPTLASITPKIATPDATITIIGTGFTENNTIHTVFGKISNVRSKNGTTLTFKLLDLKGISKLSKGAKIMVGVSVSNENGGANTPLSFTFYND